MTVSPTFSKIRFIINSITVFALLTGFGCTSTDNQSNNENDNSIEDSLMVNKPTANITEPSLNYPLTIEPTDESVQNKEVQNVVIKLKEIVSKRDTLSLFSIMDSNIVSSHGGGIYGYSSLLEVWQGKDIWKKLDQVINLGGAFEVKDKEFRFPYCQVNRFYGDWDLEWYTAGVIINSPTLFYQTTEANSKVIDTLKYSIVELVDYNVNNNGFKKIKPMGHEKVGYINSENFYSTADYMLVIEKKENNNWLITSFAPYD